MKKFVLLLEEDDHLRNLLALFFKNNGFNVLNLKKIEEIPGPTKNEEIGVIIINFGKDDEKGTEKIKYLKNKFPFSPIVVISGSEDRNKTELLALYANATEFISKPFKLEELKKVIEKYLVF